MTSECWAGSYSPQIISPLNSNREYTLCCTCKDKVIWIFLVDKGCDVNRMDISDMNTALLASFSGHK